MCSLAFYAGGLFAEEVFPTKEIEKDIGAHFLIQDFREAINRAQEGIESYPDSDRLTELLIEAYSSLGNETKALQTWQEYSRKFPQNRQKKEVLITTQRTARRSGRGGRAVRSSVP